MKLHTIPNQMHARGGLAIVSRDRLPLASYPARLNAGRIPSIQTVQADAAWRGPSGTLLSSKGGK